MNCLIALFVGMALAEGQPSAAPKAPLSAKEQAIVDKILQRKDDSIPSAPKNANSVSTANPKYKTTIAKPAVAQSTNAKETGSSATTLGPWWGLLALAALAGLVALVVRRKNGNIGDIAIVHRSFLGREGSLAVVEVEDANRQRRRLLIGLSTSGSPSMIADLSKAALRPSAPPKKSASPRQRVNIVVGDTVKNGQELLSEVLSERAAGTAPAASVEQTPTKSGTTQSEDPWLQGIEQALGKNG